MNDLSKARATWLEVGEESAAQRIDNFLFRQLKGVPKSHVYRVLRSGEVRVNSGRVGPAYRLQPGDRIRIPPVRTSARPPPARPAEFPIVYEDAALLVLDKPAGLLCVPGRGSDKQDCLSARAQRRWSDALIVHRLDMATSGLVLMARGAAMQRALSQAFAARKIEKRYQAIVDGALPEGETGWSLIDAPIAADWPRRPLRIIDAAGQPSRTRWRVLCALPERSATHLELEPLTGRTHQLRVHLASIGHPILGDALYGNEQVQARAPRLLLHATELAFVHPATQQPLRFVSAVPF